MIGTRYEEYGQFDDKLPFYLQPDIRRTPFTCSKTANWHEELEIQLCTDGLGTVLLGGERRAFQKGDIVVVGSGVIHYTGTDDRLQYTCLIVSAAFCKQVGIDYDALQFTPFLHSEELARLILELSDTYRNRALSCRTARLYEILLRILITLTENHAIQSSSPPQEAQSVETVKAVIRYIREHYSRRMWLDEIARAVCTDKYALCREFKRFTGRTIVEYTNHYRCLMAAECIASGCAVAEAARLCGFENPSFFTKTFKKYMGTLPSHYFDGR
ncbi:MAG: helix-turn-helix transcriptional regulator [Clostridia bacterium]|nr:helix-turn-helix transcriptional regulator [Clostridia bacterium]